MFRQWVNLCALLVFCSLPVACAPSQADIEKSIRDEMKSKNNVTITTIDLTKNADGTYTGTAIAENGDVYDVTTKLPERGKIEWQAVESQSTRDKKMIVEVHRVVREGMEEQYKTKVKVLNMQKAEGNKYEGKAETEIGLKYSVKAEVEGVQIKWESVPSKE